ALLAKWILAKQADLKNRSRTRILLTPALFEGISSAARESGLTKSFLIVQAIQDGLDHINPAVVEDKRCCRCDVWVLTELKDRVKLLASVSGKTPQSVLRYLISRYLQKIRSENPTPSREEGSQ